MSPKVTPEHLKRDAIVYVRQSTLGQVHDNTESQRRQYALADTAKKMGFAKVVTIDDDLGRSGTGSVARPGFQRLVASVCAGSVGAVFCIEASRLARNGRDWHHLIDLCALVGTLIVDPDGAYDPKLTNDRLLLGLKGTMSEYEVSLLRQRGLAAKELKAKRGELRFPLPAGYCWDELGRIEKDPDERVRDAIALVFRKYHEFGSARQVVIWARTSKVELPVLRQGPPSKIVWLLPSYQHVIRIIRHPIYAGAYAFGRRIEETRIVDGRAQKKRTWFRPMKTWKVLIRDHHSGYITWDEYEKHLSMMAENAHMQKRVSRKSGRGGRALLPGLLRCGRCGRMPSVVYGVSRHGHRYVCQGDILHGVRKACIGVGGISVDRAVASELLEVVAPYAIEAAMQAAETTSRASDDIRRAVDRQLQDAKYEVQLARRRYEAVDPEKRLVARELEARWNAALEHSAELEERLAKIHAQAAARPEIDRSRLLELAKDLPAAWNAPTTTTRTKQRIVRILIKEVIVDVDEQAEQAVLTIHWMGGRHSEVRVTRKGPGTYPDCRPSAVEVVRKLGGKSTDLELAVTLNRMRCKAGPGQTWTALRVRELRERLGIKLLDPKDADDGTISVDAAALRLGICVSSIRRLIGLGAIPASQAFPLAPWRIPAATLDSDAVKIAVRQVKERRPRISRKSADGITLRLPWI
jgi:DNA invertase Pin-like site-specific DNA recombinase